MIPSVVLAEFLTGQSLDSHRSVREIIGKAFFVAPFDAKAAAIAAELFDKSTFDTIRQDDQVGRQCLKADYQIVATAIAHGATTIYADDEHLPKIADGQILVRPVPDIPGTQNNLFDEEE